MNERTSELANKRTYRFSVIVPVYNDWHRVPELLDRLQQQTLAREEFEIILVDNASEQFTPPDAMPPNARIEKCETPGSYAARNHGIDPEMIRAVESVNNRQKGHLFELICRHYGGDSALEGKRFALWGLAFKPNTDDMGEAASLKLIEQLGQAGARVAAFDPEAMDEARRAMGGRECVDYVEHAEQALDGADALVIVTEWKQFRSPDFQLLQSKLADQAVFDGRNLYDPAKVEANGLAYYAIGRGPKRGSLEQIGNRWFGLTLQVKTRVLNPK